MKRPIPRADNQKLFFVDAATEEELEMPVGFGLSGAGGGSIIYIFSDGLKVNEIDLDAPQFVRDAWDRHLERK